MYQFTTDETVVNENGGAQSKSVGRADLVPPKALTEVAKVLGEGAVKYGEWNWKRIAVNEHINHALIHTYAYLANDTSENHLVNATCRLMFALELLIEEEAIIEQAKKASEFYKQHQYLELEE